MYEFTNLKPNGIYDAYLRKSRADVSLENTKKIDTLKQHEQFIIKRAKDLNINVRNWYKEVVSGDSISARPEIQRLLMEVEKGEIDGVIVVDIDRLARGDTKDQGIISRTFKYTSTKIITLMKIYDPNNDEDEDFFEFNLFMARKEYKAINKRQQRGRISSVLNGKYCGSIPPYGYNKVKIKNDKGYTLDINEEEANIVKTIFLKRNNGEGLNIICNYLNNLNIKPRKSDVWTPSTLNSILNNPVYLGKIRWNYNKTVKIVKNGEIIKNRKKAKKEDIILVEGLHPAIISDEIFNNVTKEKLSNSSVRNDLDMQNPIAGLVKCSACGRNMVRRPYSTTKVVRAENSLNKEELLTCLRSHKGKYSLNEISLYCGYTKYTVDKWFSTTKKYFVVPPIEAWYKLKELLNIETDKFDKDIEAYHTKVETVHIDSLICPKSHCITVASHLYLVEDRMLIMTRKYLNERKKIVENYIPSNNTNESNMADAFKKKIKSLEQQLEKAYELVENNIYTAEEFTKRTKKIKANIELNKKELKKINDTLNTNDIKPMIAIAEKILNIYPQINSIEEKNNLLKSIINSVEYTKIKGGKKHFQDFELKVDFKF